MRLSNVSQERKRLFFIWVILFVVCIGLGGRIYYLQMVKAEFLQQKAQQQQQVSLTPYIPRRSIIDRHDNVLATDRMVYDLYVHPRFFSDEDSDEDPKEEIAKDLAKILDDYTQAELLDRFETRSSGIKLADGLREQVATNIEKLHYNGVDLIQKYARYYPYKDLAGNVIGYVQKDNHQGQTGVELTQQNHLQRSVKGNLQVQITSEGEILPKSVPKNAVTFDERKLQLTLDLKLQRYAQNALRKTIRQNNAKRGTLLVMNPHTGELLSLVSEPNYDPNHYFNYDLKSLRNWAVTDLYEPGSTFKPINVAIALEAGVINPNTQIYDGGRIKIGGWTIRNHDYFSEGAHGMLEIPEILQLSSNIGMIKVMQRMTPESYYKRLQELEIDEPVGIELTGETSGQFKSKFQFTNYEIEPATASFGQGFSLTPIKLAQLHSAIANGGKLVTPHVVRGLVDQEGELQPLQNHESKDVFSSQTTQQVLQMMETVVSEGTAETADIAGYELAGKTGTSQKASVGGYSFDNVITSFVGIFPVDNPRYVVLAVVDNPKIEMAYGSTVAAPLVKDVIEELITMKGIPPTHPEELVSKESQ